MIKNLNILVVLLLSINCKAQNTYPLSNFQPKHLKNNNYIKDTENVYESFEGTWQWTNGTSTFTVKLQKVEHWKMPNSNYFKDLIMGGYRYVENGNLIIDKLTFTTEFPNETTASSFAKIQGGISYPVINKLIIIIRVVIKNKSCMTELTLQTGPDGEQQLQWYLHDFQSYRDPSLGPKPLDFSIPTNVVLTKLENLSTTAFKL